MIEAFILFRPRRSIHFRWQDSCIPLDSIGAAGMRQGSARRFRSSERTQHQFGKLMRPYVSRIETPQRKVPVPVTLTLPQPGSGRLVWPHCPV